MSNSDLTNQIIQLAMANNDIDVLWLYGSRAKGTATENSDYDLAVAFKDMTLNVVEKQSRPNELALDWAMKLNVPEDVISIVDINSIPTYLALNIVEYGQVINAQNHMRAIKEQNRIRSQYEFQERENRLNV